MRGQFVRGDGLIIPNNISSAGAEMILKSAFQNESYTLFAALVTGAPSKAMTLVDMTEPTVGTNGYARIPILRNSTGWPTTGELNGEVYIETQDLVWVPAGGNFDELIQRLALVGGATPDPDEPIFALSAPLADPLEMTPSLSIGLRTFKYQIFI